MIWWWTIWGMILRLCTMARNLQRARRRPEALMQFRTPWVPLLGLRRDHFGLVLLLKRRRFERNAEKSGLTKRHLNMYTVQECSDAVIYMRCSVDLTSYRICL